MFIERTFTEEEQIDLYLKNESRRVRLVEVSMSLRDDRTVGCLDGTGSCGVGSNMVSQDPLLAASIFGGSSSTCNGPSPAVVSHLWIMQPGEELHFLAYVAGTLTGVVKFSLHVAPRDGEIVKTTDDEHFALTM